MDTTPKFKELHACMGLNSCKDLGFTQQNDCAGMGACATNMHPCHTLNECRGQGGCGLYGTTEEFCFPTLNDCRYQGSCGTPILDSRFICQGPNRGRSVWQLARKRFEEKRTAAGQPYGPPPAGPYGPSNGYVNQLNKTTNKDYASCGNSGNRHCSYVADPTVRQQAADERVLQSNMNSARHIQETLATCPTSPPSE